MNTAALTPRWTPIGTCRAIAAARHRRAEHRADRPHRVQRVDDRPAVGALHPQAVRVLRDVGDRVARAAGEQQRRQTAPGSVDSPAANTSSAMPMVHSSGRARRGERADHRARGEPGDQRADREGGDDDAVARCWTAPSSVLSSGNRGTRFAKMAPLVRNIAETAMRARLVRRSTSAVTTARRYGYAATRLNRQDCRHD